MKRYALLLVIAVAGMGCGEQFIFPESGDPQIEVRVPDLTEVPLRDYVQGTVEIQNVGDGTLGVGSLSIKEVGGDATDEVFAVGSAWNHFHVLRPGESLDLTVRYEPANMTHDRASVVMEHNDASKGQYSWKIPLPTVGPELEVVGTGPNGNLTFSKVEPGTSRSKAILIKNEGNYPLDLEKIKLGANPHFSFEIIEGPEGNSNGI